MAVDNHILTICTNTRLCYEKELDKHPFLTKDKYAFPVTKDANVCTKCWKGSGAE